MQVLGEDLGVAGLVHRLGRRVVLGVDPRHGLDDLGRDHHRALLAVHELAERRLERLDAQLRRTPSRPTSRAASRASSAAPRASSTMRFCCGEVRTSSSGSTSIDQSRSVTELHCERHRLVVEGDQLVAAAVVVPEEDPLRVVGDQLDRSRPLLRVRADGGCRWWSRVAPFVAVGAEARHDPGDELVPRGARRARHAGRAALQQQTEIERCGRSTRTASGSTSRRRCRRRMAASTSGCTALRQFAGRGEQRSATSGSRAGGHVRLEPHCLGVGERRVLQTGHASDEVGHPVHTLGSEPGRVAGGARRPRAAVRSWTEPAVDGARREAAPRERCPGSSCPRIPGGRRRVRRRRAAAPGVGRPRRSTGRSRRQPFVGSWLNGRDERSPGSLGRPSTRSPTMFFWI